MGAKFVAFTPISPKQLIVSVNKLKAYVIRDPLFPRLSSYLMGRSQ